MQTFYSYYRGFNLAGVGAAAAGYTDIGGVEYDPAIAAVCDANHPDSPTTVVDVHAVDPALLLDRAPTWFHASPVCTRASTANQPEADEDGNVVREAELDRLSGQAVARFISTWTPQYVSIENVWGYRTFDAFQTILQSLREGGYSFDYWHLNSADYGVPQTRRRLILMARRGELRFVQRPNPTHRQGGDMFHAPWVGWYAAIEDLLDTLPASKFAQWQLDRLPEEVRESVLVEGNTPTTHDPLVCASDDPMWTVRAAANKGMSRAFILDGQKAGDPAGERGVTVPHGDAPVFTITSGTGTTRPARAWLVDSANTGRRAYKEDPGAPLVMRDERTPAYTVASSGGDGRALLVTEDSKATSVWCGQPAQTVVASERAARTRALLVHSTDQRSIADARGGRPRVHGDGAELRPEPPARRAPACLAQ